MTKQNDVRERFWAQVYKTPNCWFWLGTLSEHGYGRFWLNGRTWQAHEISWELANGKPFPLGLNATHTCDTPPCVNPAHVIPRNHSDNMKDCADKGRNPIYRKVLSKVCPNRHVYEQVGFWLKRTRGTRICKGCDAARKAARS